MSEITGLASRQLCLVLNSRWLARLAPHAVPAFRPRHRKMAGLETLGNCLLPDYVYSVLQESTYVVCASVTTLLRDSEVSIVYHQSYLIATVWTTRRLCQ
jgi:hypothetical protein